MVLDLHRYSQPQMDSDIRDFCFAYEGLGHLVLVIFMRPLVGAYCRHPRPASAALSQKPLDVGPCNFAHVFLSFMGRHVPIAGGPWL